MATDDHDAGTETTAKLLELISIRRISEAIYVAAALGIADLLADGPRTAEELAMACGAQPEELRRVLRALSSIAVLSHDDAGRFALAAMGERLRSDVSGSLRPAALWFGGERAAQIDGLLLHCVKTGETAVHKLSGVGRFEGIQNDPEQAAIFNATMTAYSTLHLTGVLEAYDFSAIKQLVDVGGGHGKNIAEILTRHSQMRGVLFDMPHAFDGGKKTIADTGLTERCEVVSGDFFQSVPEGADAYLLSRVIHDWNDERAVAILKVVRKAIAPDGKLILLEVMIRGGDRPLYPVLSDLNMMLRTGGCERTESEYRALYQAAGFKLIKTVATTSPTGTTVIEGRPA
jgi:O-methyltransferase/methyltransferase family protein